MTDTYLPIWQRIQTKSTLRLDVRNLLLGQWAYIKIVKKNF
jgi:hypothetical protein